jgi:muramidase (phage lysozyme)
MPDLKMDSVTSGKVGKVLDLIASKESAGYYDIMFGGRRYPEILNMTLQELQAFATAHGKRTGSSASGRYQIMGFNIAPYAQKAGLNFKTDKFSPENQDKMGIIFLRECGLESWLSGKLSNERFLDKIAGVWMAFANSKGISPHAGDGLNKEGIRPQWTLAALDRIQNTTA